MKLLHATAMSFCLLGVFVTIMAAMSYMDQGYGLHPALACLLTAALTVIGYTQAAQISED